jgi:hypothetical protein
MYGLSEGRQWSEQTLRYYFETIQSTNNLQSKGPLDLQFFHKVTSELNKYISGTTFSSVADVKNRVKILLDRNSKDNIMSEIGDIAHEVYGDEKYHYGDWDSEFSGLLMMFTKELDNIVVSQPNNQYNLVWEDSITHSFIRYNNDLSLIPTILTGGMLKEDPNFFGIIEFSEFTDYSIVPIRFPSQIDSNEIFDVPMIVVHDSETGQWGLIHSDQLDGYKNLDHRFQLGFRDPNTGTIFEDVILNTREGYILDGRIALENGRLYDRGRMWFKQYLSDARYFSGQIGDFTLSNCYRNIMYITGRHIVPSLHKITYNFVSTPTYEPYFKEEGISPSRLKTFQDDFKRLTFINPDFMNNPNYAMKSSNDAKEFINSISNLIYLIENTEMNYGYLPLDNYYLRVLNSYIDGSGNVHFGPSYNELEYIFNKLIPLFADSEIYEDPDNLPFKLFNIKKRSDRESETSNVLRNMGFRNSQSQKEWFNKWLTIFKMLDQNSLTPNSLDERLRKIIIERENSFSGENFDFDTSDTLFTDKDLELAQRIKTVLIDLLGRFTFEKLYTGGIFPKDGHISFIRQPWYNINKILKHQGFSLQFGYDLPGWSISGSKMIAGEKGPIDIRRRFILDTFLSSGGFDLPTYKNFDSKLSRLSFSEVPVELWAPHLRKPSVSRHIDYFYLKASHSSYSLFQQYQGSTEPINIFRAKYSFLNRLLEVGKDKYGYDNNKIGIAYKGLMAKIFTEDYHKAWDFMTG